MTQVDPHLAPGTGTKKNILLSFRTREVVGSFVNLTPCPLGNLILENMLVNDKGELCELELGCPI